MIALIIYFSVMIFEIHCRYFDFNSTKTLDRFKRQIDCKGFKCNSGECIEYNFKCDGLEQCPDGSDETESVCKSACPGAGYLFHCNYGACISPYKICDGIIDCRDFSDELNCDINNNTCNWVHGYLVGGQFRCGDSNKCIPERKACNGVADCANKADETSEACSKKSCPENKFQCKYGACVASSARCDFKRDCIDDSDEKDCPGRECILPPFPENGKWAVQYGERQEYKAGDNVSEWSTVLFYCDRGYVLRNKMSRAQVCRTGSWLKVRPECLKSCPAVLNTSTTFMNYTLDGEIVDCLQAPEGAILTYSCKQFYVLEDSDIRKCSNGSWNKGAPKCVQECGGTNAPSTPLIVNGSKTQLHEFPWHIAIFRRSKGNFQNICGGSLITPKLVLSAAHCVNAEGKPLPTDIFKVGAGKHYLNYEDDRDKGSAQYRDVFTILVPSTYNGLTKGYLGDIAVLVVTEGFILAFNVRPICLGKRNEVPQDGQMGKVVGWGYITEGSNRSEVLKNIDLPFVNYTTCYSLLPEDFRRAYLEKNDKMCAGYFNESRGVCSGDSGGGLVFRNREGKFYLGGIVSITSGIVPGVCNANTFALFTKIADHRRTLIEDALATYL